MLRGHPWPRRYARPMISPRGCRMVRSAGRIHAWGRFHIGGVAYCVWAFPPTVGALPGTDRCIATRPLRSQRQSTFCCSALRLGSSCWPSQLPLEEAHAPQAKGVHARHRHGEAPTVADAVIETEK